MEDSGYAEQDKQIDTTRETREQRDKIVIEDRYTTIEVRDPTLTDELFRVPAALSLNPPKWTVTTDKTDTPEQRNTTLRENVTQQLFRVAGHQSQGQSTHSRLVDACTADGGAWGKFLYKKDVWTGTGATRVKKPNESDAAYNSDTEDARKKAGPPFVWLSEDPRTVYPAWSGTNLESMITATEAPFLSSLRKYGLTIEGGGLVPGTIGERQARDSGLPKSIKIYEYWDETWCSIIMDAPEFGDKGTAVTQAPWRHGYGRVPYFFAPGLMMNHWRNRKVGWGVAHTKMALVRYMSYLLTVHADVAARDAYTPVVRYLGDGQVLLQAGSNLPKTRDEHVGLRDIIIAQHDEKWDQFPVRDTAPALKEQMALVRTMIESMLTPKVSSQIGGGLEGAGFAINQVLAEAKISQHPFVENLENMYVDATRFAWELIERKVGSGKVYVYVAGDAGSKTKGGYLGLGASDLKMAVQVDVEIDPERPTAKLIEGQYHQQQVAAGFESQDMAIIAQGRNPDEVHDGEALDRVRKRPAYQKWEEDEIAYAAGMGQILELAQQAQQVAATGVPPGMSGAAGQQETPNMGALAAAPNQAMPDNGGTPPPGPIPQPGPASGTPIIPQQSAASGIQPQQ